MVSNRSLEITWVTSTQSAAIIGGQRSADLRTHEGEVGIIAGQRTLISEVGVGVGCDRGIRYARDGVRRAERGDLRGRLLAEDQRVFFGRGRRSVRR